MKARFVHEGKAIDYTPPFDVAAGEVVVQEELVAIALRDMTAGQLGALQVSGVFEVVKETGLDTGISTGGKVYWNKSNNIATKNTVPEITVYMGKAVNEADDDDTSVLVRLEQ